MSRHWYFVCDARTRNFCLNETFQNRSFSIINNIRCDVASEPNTSANLFKTAWLLAVWQEENEREKNLPKVFGGHKSQSAVISQHLVVCCPSSHAQTSINGLQAFEGKNTSYNGSGKKRRSVYVKAVPYVMLVSIFESIWS